MGLLQIGSLGGTFGVSGGGGGGSSAPDGTIAYPYYTADTGEAGIDALTAQAGTPTDGVFGIIGANATPILFRYSEAMETWVRPICYSELVAPNVIAGESPSDAGWTDAVGSGGAIDYNSTVANRVAIKSGNSMAMTPSTTYVDPRPTSSYMALVLTGAKVLDSVAVGDPTYFALRDANSDAAIVIATGGLNGTADSWSILTDALGVVYVDLGIYALSESTIEAYMDIGHDMTVTIWVSRGAVPVFHGPILFTSTRPWGEIVAAYQGAQTQVSFIGFHGGNF